jgi:hypothetical protein
MTGSRSRNNIVYGAIGASVVAAAGAIGSAVDAQCIGAPRLCDPLGEPLSFMLKGMGALTWSRAVPWRYPTLQI